MTLDKQEVSPVTFTWCAEEVVETNIVQHGRRSETGKVAAQLFAFF